MSAALLLLASLAFAAPGSALEPLWGQTPILRVVLCGPEEGRETVERELARRKAELLREGLLLRTAEAIARGACGPSAEEDRLAIRDSRELGRALDAYLGPETGRRARFALPAPAHDPRDPPALRDARAGEEDFRALEAGLEDAARLAGRLFPFGVDAVEAVIYDTTFVHVYSKNAALPFEKVRTWKDYSVYRVAHGSRPLENEMDRCAAGHRSTVVLTEKIRAALGEHVFSCSPWREFRRYQARRRSPYRFLDGYRATVIHEIAHLYQAAAPDPSPEMLEIQRRIDAMELQEVVNPAQAAQEGFAAWCELAAARELYPRHFKTLMAGSRREGKDDSHGHMAGLRAAAALIEEEGKGRE